MKILILNLEKEEEKNPKDNFVYIYIIYMQTRQ